MKEEEKIAIKKLMQDTLTEEERMALLNSRPVTKLMNRQWDEAGRILPDAASVDDSRIWQNICRRIGSAGSNGRDVFYQIYSLVASVLLILGIGSAAYFLTTREEVVPMYVVSSGIQNVESVSLPDGTTVQMGPGSKLTYPERFNAETRTVRLDGQAFFDVAKDRTKPFIVQTVQMDVTAVGTAFEVFSYEWEDKVETILLNGKVNVGLKSGGKEREVSLLPNEMLVYDKKDGRVEVKEVDADKYSSWRNNGVLSFENENLSMIIPRLEQWYGRQIMCEKEVADTFRFTFKVRDETLERILFMLSKSSSVGYEEVSGNYRLYPTK